MGRSKPFKVLIIGPIRIASFEIGLLQPFSLLQKQRVCEYKTMDEEEVTRRSISAADIIIFSRTSKPQAYQCLEWAREMKKRTVYVIDDHFLAMPPATDIGKIFKDPNYRKTFTRFLKNSNIVKVASPFFEKHLKKHFRTKRIVCFPGSVNFSLLTNLKRNKRNDQKVIIGYAGGKKEEAFTPVIRALKRVVRKFGDKVEIQFFGYIPPELRNYPNVTHVNYERDYSKYLRGLYRLNWDIGLAPLENALYHDCKTDNKFREYAACYIPSVYSNTPPYKDSVKNRKTGLLVDRSVDDWYAALKAMIENPELRRRIRHRAGKIARQRYSIEVCAKNWQNKILK